MQLAIEQSKPKCFSLINIEYRAYMLYMLLRRKIMVVITMGIHLLPYRTEKLSPLVPMILLYQVGK